MSSELRRKTDGLIRYQQQPKIGRMDECTNKWFCCQSPQWPKANSTLCSSIWNMMVSRMSEAGETMLMVCSAWVSQLMKSCRELWKSVASFKASSSFTWRHQTSSGSWMWRCYYFKQGCRGYHTTMWVPSLLFFAQADSEVINKVMCF